MTPSKQSLKCHFDADGWLQGPINITHYLSPNHYATGFADNARGLVQHTEDGYSAGTIATFMSEASQASAFFGVGEDGAAQQFLPVGRGLVAWAQGSGNPLWRSCECEDKTKTNQPMTQPQMTAFAQILEVCSAYDGFPLQITDDPANGHGLITHGAGGNAWGGHPNCPGDVRKAQRPALIALAKQIRAGGNTPAKPPANPATLPPVRNLEAAGAKPESVRLTWDSPQGPSNYAVGWYQITIRQGGKDIPTYPRWARKAASPQTAVCTDLPPGQELRGMVRATDPNREHDSDWEYVDFSTPAAPKESKP